MFKLFKKTPDPEEMQPVEVQTGTPGDGDGTTGTPDEETPETKDQQGEHQQQDTAQEPDTEQEEASDKEQDTSEDKTHEDLTQSLTECFDSWLKANVEDEAARAAATEAMGAVETALKDFAENQAEPVMLFELIAKGADYSRAVTEAETAGEIRGRNARIEEERELRFNDDGVPHPGAGGNCREMPMPSIFQVARGVY